MCLIRTPLKGYIHHNNFVNNTNQAYDECSNYWDDGSEGNYWSNYNGSDRDGDGIGDTPYNISGGNNQDRYPLINPVAIANLPPSIDWYSPRNSPTIKEEENITFSITATDPESTTLSYFWYLDGRLRLASQTNYTVYTNYTSAGVYNITVIVSDGITDIRRFWVLTVLNKNRVPSLQQVGNQTTHEGQTFVLQINGTDLDNDALIFSDNSTLFDINSTTGLILFTPSYDSAGIYLVNISVTDKESLVWQTFQLTIVNVNRAPTAVISSPAQNAKFTANDKIYFDAAGSYDLDDDNLSYVWNSSIDGLLSTNKSFSKKLSPGNHTIILTVSDGQDAETKQITLIVEKLQKKKGWVIPAEGLAITAVVCAIAAIILILRKLR